MLQEIEKSWDEFWAAYWRIEHRHSIPGIFEWDRQLVTFVEDVCDLPAGARILDLGCGGGDQALVFAKRGYDVVGIDIAPVLVDHARRRFAEDGLSGEFRVGDMRELDFREQFDAVVILSGTFGFFGREGDVDVLRRIRRALKPDGRTFLSFLSAHTPPEHTRAWREVDGGWYLNEVWFDAEKSARRSRNFIIRKEGTLIRPKAEPGYRADETIYCYTVPELQRMLAAAGLRAVATYNSRRLEVPVPEPEPTLIRDVMVARPEKESS